METAVKTRLQSIQFGDVQLYKGIAIVPLLTPADGAIQYHTLGEALAASDLSISEVSAAGSVPELLVLNRGDSPVLLVDGEEVAGAKQNRVLNTSILIREKSETKIPVSCTEQGRWAYSSDFFSDSGLILAHKSRSKKSHSVLRSLESSGVHRSDQHEVWREIRALHEKSGTHSPTSAMDDVYKARADDLRQCEEIFKPVPRQVGMLTFIAGSPAGLDLVSLAGAYAKLHPKLVRSYALEGLLVTPKPSDSSSSPQSTHAAAIANDARKFLDEIMATEERQFPSVGYGVDFRYRTPAASPGSPSTSNPQPRISGSALVHQNEVIHAAFFRLDDTVEPDRMASLRERVRHFTR